MFKVEVWTRAFRKLIWRGELSALPRAGEELALSDHAVEDVRKVRHLLDEGVIQIELDTTDSDGEYQEPPR